MKIRRDKDALMTFEEFMRGMRMVGRMLNPPLISDEDAAHRDRAFLAWCYEPSFDSALMEWE